MARGKTRLADRIEGIVRAPRAEPYENIRVAVLRDDRISFRATGVLGRLLTNDDNFRQSSTALANERPGGEGRDAIRAALRELEDAGYLLRIKLQNSKGHWTTILLVGQSPQELRAGIERLHSAGFQSSVAQSSENRASVFQALKSSNTNKQYQKEKTTTTANLIWDALPRFSSDDQAIVVGMMQRLDQNQHQTVLDELAGALRGQAIKGQWPGWLHSVIKKATQGNFQPNHALAVQAGRKQQIEAAAKAIVSQLEEVIRKAENDFRLELIDEDERNRRIAEARQKLRNAT